MKRLAALALLAACGGPSRPITPPVAMTIKPLGDVETPDLARPANSDEPEMPVQIALSTNRLCARVDGRVYCRSQVNLDPPLVQDKLRMSGVDDAIDISGSGGLLCVATRRGTVLCSGSNEYGELGAQSKEDRSDTFVEVTGVSHAKRVSAGRNHACATLDDRRVQCWGKNENGQTGSDTFYQAPARELVRASLVPNVKSDNAVAGGESTCARTPERHVVCWGFQQDREQAMKTGHGQNERPTRMPELDDISALTGHDEGYCAVRRGHVLCWGNARRLIPGTDYFGSGIVSVAEIKDAQHVALADAHGCILHTDGRVSCFGYPYTYALGRAGPSDPQKQYEAQPPEVVEGLPRARFVAVGGMQSCALTYGNDLYCWGRWYTDAGTHDEVKSIAIQLR